MILSHEGIIGREHVVLGVFAQISLVGLVKTVHELVGVVALIAIHVVDVGS